MGADKPAEGCGFETSAAKNAALELSREGTFAPRLSDVRKKQNEGSD
jgi:hypothetical protein